MTFDLLLLPFLYANDFLSLFFAFILQQSQTNYKDFTTVKQFTGTMLHSEWRVVNWIPTGAGLILTLHSGILDVVFEPPYPDTVAWKFLLHFLKETDPSVSREYPITIRFARSEVLFSRHPSDLIEPYDTGGPVPRQIPHYIQRLLDRTKH